MEPLPTSACPSCRALVSVDMLFCPACGKPLKNNPTQTSTGRQIFVYTMSVLLPPIGFWYAWKYFKQPDKKAKTIGWVAIVLTIISIIANVWVMAGYLSQFKQSLGVIDTANF